MIDKLKNLELFESFPEQVLEELIPYISEVKYKEGDYIIKEGSEGAATYIVNSGTVEVKKQGKILGVVSTGSVFGEMAFFDNPRRSADVIAKEATSVYRINSSDFKKFIYEHPSSGIDFLFKSMKTLSSRLKQTSDHFVTVFETGKIVGANYSLKDMTEKILTKILSDITNSTGGMILIMNPFSAEYESAYEKDMQLLNLETAIELVQQSYAKKTYFMHEDGVSLAVPINEEEKTLGFIIVEKKNTEKDFSIEEEIIINTVANQIGLGILHAYSKQEDEARDRLQMNRMKRH